MSGAIRYWVTQVAVIPNPRNNSSYKGSHGLGRGGVGVSLPPNLPARGGVGISLAANLPASGGVGVSLPTNLPASAVWGLALGSLRAIFSLGGGRYRILILCRLLSPFYNLPNRWR